MKQPSFLHRTAVLFDDKETFAAAAAQYMATNIETEPRRRRYYILPGDWVWWAWALTAALLIVGLCGHDTGFLSAIAVTLIQTGIVLVRDQHLTAFSVQLRVAYLLLLIISYPPPMRWLYWVPTLGTLALTLFGYCILARILSLLPWLHRERYTLERMRRTFFSAPDLNRSANSAAVAGGLCTIEAQVPPAPERQRDQD